MNTALITGANSGFGYLMALTFARDGYKVFATTRSLEKDGVKRLNKIAKNESLNIEWLVFDVSNESEVRNALTPFIDGTSDLDVLVNNAGYGVVGNIENFNIEDVKKQMAVNYTGALNLIYPLLPSLKATANKRFPSKIINISSIAGFIPVPGYGIYAASKHALSSFSETLRAELSDSNIDVAIIEPAGFDTKFASNASTKGDVEFRELHDGDVTNPNNSSTPWRRDPQRVANLALKIAKRYRSKLHNPIGEGALLLYWGRKVLPQAFWSLAFRLFYKFRHKD